MAAFNKIDAFAESLAEAGYNLQTDTIKAALSNTAPTAASTVWAIGTFPAPAAANGYTAGGNTITVSSSAQTAGLYRWIIADSTFTAAGGQMGPFRYVILYDVTASNKIIGWYDYGSSITLNDTETFTADFDNVNGTLTLQ